jgi:predicted TIM-barrel fold metal-dependent hydrolase
MLTEIVDLARAFPDTQIILNHLAGPIGVGRFHGKRDEVFADWCVQIGKLAQCHNIFMKLSGFGAELMGFGWTELSARPSPTVIADAIRPYVEVSVHAFSPARCMVGSNFPVDCRSFDYGDLWSAVKCVISRYSVDEQRQLLHGTAAGVYRITASA